MVPARKVTPDEAPVLVCEGLVRARMDRGRLVVMAGQPSNTALLRLVVLRDRGPRGREPGERL